jgi:hypothetical protein
MCYNAAVTSDSNVPLFIVGGRGVNSRLKKLGFLPRFAQWK